VDEGRKRVIGIMAAILASLHMRTADDLFGGPQGSPRSDQLIAASVQWAREIVKKIDGLCDRPRSESLLGVTCPMLAYLVACPSSVYWGLHSSNPSHVVVFVRGEKLSMLA